MSGAMEVDNNNWVFVSKLGSGSFGIVQLWRNKLNSEEIAIKRCKSSSAQLSPKQKERWIREVETMKRLRHPNIVASRPVPPEAEDTEPSLPVLCMEYCKRGDLRSVLSDVENCCGLPEPVAVQIMLEISAAVEYLHSHSLTHRDLKPENIVLQQINSKVVYKLIDLGYTKLLTHASMDASIVGTMNYVAPEVLWERKYTRSVDYWSLGILFYEVITGNRPLLPEEAELLAWKVAIEKKTDRDIAARYVDGKIQFLQDIQEPNYISPIIRDQLVDWFRIVLQWDSKQRGWGMDENGVDKVVVFEKLKKILSIKIVRVFSVPQYKIFSYGVQDSVIVRQLQSLIENDTKVIISSQEILNSDGEILNSDQILQDIFLTLFRKEDVAVDSPPPNTPALLTQMILSSGVGISYNELKRCYSTAFFYVKQEVELFGFYILALSMKIDLINKRIDALSKKKSYMMSGINSLKAQFQSTSELLNSDTRNGFAKWQKEIEVTSSKLECLLAIVADLESKCDTFSRICGTLTEFGGIDWTTKHQDYLSKVQDLAERSRSLPRMDKHTPVSMAQLIVRFQKFHHAQMNDERLSKIGSQIGLMTTAAATEELSKLEKYVESAAALTTVYCQEISNLHKTWKNHRQAVENLENMDIEHNDDDVQASMPSADNNSEIDTIISEDVIFDNLVIRYMIHDVMTETYERFSQIVNLNPDEGN